MHAPTWDPEKVELSRIIDRLLLLEERRVPGRPSMLATPQKVKLNGFWEKSLATWFSLADASMADSNVQDPHAKYRVALLHVPAHILERASGALNLAETAADPCEELNARLVELLTPSLLERCNSILRGAELGGRRPSELMDGMMSALPPGHADCPLFKAAFLNRLPSDLADLVAVQFKQLEAK